MLFEKSKSGGEFKKTKTIKNRRREEMENILFFETNQRDLKVEIDSFNDSDISYAYRCLITSNSDNIEIFSEKEELYEIVGMLFAELQTAGKITEIEIDENIYQENEFSKVIFSDDEVEIHLANDDVIYTNIVDCEFKTVCFGTDEYSEVLNSLRLEVDKAYEKHAA